MNGILNLVIRKHYDRYQLLRVIFAEILVIGAMLC